MPREAFKVDFVSEVARIVGGARTGVYTFCSIPKPDRMGTRQTIARVMCTNRAGGAGGGGGGLHLRLAQECN